MHDALDKKLLERQTYGTHSIKNYLLDHEIMLLVHIDMRNILVILAMPRTDFPKNARP